MARGDQLGRQWKIIQTLIASPRGKTAAQLADALDYHWRTVYRDLEALQAAGFPLYTEKTGRQNRWCLLDSARKSIPIPLIPAELMALFFSRDMLKTRLKGTVFYDSLESLLRKIKTTLAPDFAGNLERIEKSLHVAPQPFKPHERFREILDQVNAAVLDRRHIDITYYTMSRTEVTRRRLAPYRIWFFDGTFYIIGHCRLRDGVRIFALDRIKDLRLSEEPFEMPADFDAEAFMKDSFGVYQGKPARVRIWFAPEAAGYIRERTWHSTQSVQENPDGSLIFEATVAGTEEIKFWILKWGARAKVLAPGALKAAIRAEAEAMLAGCAP